MANELIQVQYEQLTQMAQRFERLAGDSDQLHQRVRQQVNDLKHSGWVGRGGTAFAQEMEQLVLPAVRRLTAVFEEASQVTHQTIQILQDAEEEAANLFKGSQTPDATIMPVQPGVGTDAGIMPVKPGVDTDAGVMPIKPGVGTDAGIMPVPGVPGGVGTDVGIMPVSDGGIGTDAGIMPVQPEAGGGTPAEGGVGTDAGIMPVPDTPTIDDYTIRDPHSVFRESYMNAMIDSPIQGANSAVLNDAMEKLMRQPPPTGEELENLLAIIAKERGKSLDTMRSQYQRYLEIAALAKKPPAELDITSEWFDFTDNPDHLGSTVSLRYGKVVGDVFGIDPVFGSLLNPTGGLMGPDNGYPFQPAEDRPLSYHAIFHDAGGFLYNSYGIGPGYNYLGLETWRSPGDPLTGQLSGIRYWHQQLDSPGPDAIVEPLIEEAVDAYIYHQDQQTSLPPMGNFRLDALVAAP